MSKHIKGIVQPLKRGVMGGINRNSKKRIRAVKQLSLGQVSIMWLPLFFAV
jgi:hypothetical protein